MYENGDAIPGGEQKETDTVCVPYSQESGEEGRTAERRVFRCILGKGTCSQKAGQVGEGGPVQARNHGATGDQTLSEVDSTANQEVTLPEAGEGNRAGFQVRSSFPGSGHTMSPRGSRGILGQTVRGHEPVRDTRQEGDHPPQRSPAGSAYPWRRCVDGDDQKNTKT